VQVVVLGGGSFGTAMAAHVAAKKADLEVAMLLRDDLVCRSINQRHINWFVILCFFIVDVPQQCRKIILLLIETHVLDQ
jgi:hypothetical protein